MKLDLEKISRSASSVLVSELVKPSCEVRSINGKRVWVVLKYLDDDGNDDFIVVVVAVV